MTITQAGIIAAALALLAPMSASTSHAAKAHGVGLHVLHFAHHHHRHRGFWPLYGGVVVAGNNEAAYAIPEPTPVPLLVRSCRHSQDVVTVPSEDGGTRRITITRC